ncbi:hypothetical protein D3C85_1907330 [compost metagenome]
MPQGGEGASRINRETGARAAAIWATSPPIEWPIRTGGSSQVSHKAATCLA